MSLPGSLPGERGIYLAAGKWIGRIATELERNASIIAETDAVLASSAAYLRESEDAAQRRKEREIDGRWMR